MNEENHDNKEDEPLSKLEKILGVTVLGAAAVGLGLLWLKRTAGEANRRAAERNLPKPVYRDELPEDPTNPIPDDLRPKPGVIYPPGTNLLKEEAEKDKAKKAVRVADDAARQASDEAARRAADAARRAADDAARRAADDAARRAADRRY